MLKESEIQRRYEACISNAAVQDDDELYAILFGKAQAYGTVLGYSYDLIIAAIDYERNCLMSSLA